MAGISITKFGLSKDLELFKKESKTEKSKYDPRFSDLFRALKKAQIPEILRLAGWVRHLKEQNYHADINMLRSL